jgi:hypothetical protein
MRTIILFIILISTKIVCGQKDSVVDNRFCINTAPLSFIDVFGGNSYRIGLEYKLYKNIAHSIEIGKYFNYSAKGFFTPLKINPQGFIIRTSLKYYLNKKSRTVGDYLSIEYLYKNITIHKEISAVTIKYGSTKIFKNRFVIDLYAGIGARFFTKGYSTLTPEEEAGVLTGENHDDLVGGGQRVYKDFWIPNLNAGIKLGFRVK